jgi:hypothetical protein
MSLDIKLGKAGAPHLSCTKVWIGAISNCFFVLGFQTTDHP